jgi:protein SCO1
VGARRIRLALYVGLACAAVFARWATSRAIALPELGTLPAFQLSDERGARLGRDALLGKVTVVDFIFTSCSTACPVLSAEMARIQDHVRHKGLTDRVRLLSISVDPERDTPERLRAFGARWGADAGLWRFARGDEAELRRVVVDGMKQAVERQLDRGELDGFTILHGTRMVLVDEEARIRGYYDASDADDRARLRRDLEALADGRVTRRVTQ